MKAQTTFQRYEIKYLLSKKQSRQLIDRMQPYMALDQFGHSTIRSIYYDTDTDRLIRASIERPVYKEKLRLRSYEQAAKDDTVFVELKKKFQSVVYKRRVATTRQQATDWLGGRAESPLNNQISREIDYFCSYYQTLRPKVFLSYEREAFYALDGGDFRITLDENILYRQDDLSLGAAIYGAPLLPKGQVLLEVKTAGGLPLWMTQFLSEQQLYKTSFSKYGTAYQRIQAQQIGGRLYA